MSLSGITPGLTRRETTASCDKFSMKDKLIPVGSNRLLDRLRVAACHSAEYFLTVACRNFQARITPALTRAERIAFNLRRKEA
jgi:hypothetical protein